MDGNKREDALFVRESTSKDDILAYVRQNIRNPIRFDGNTVWNFSSYEFDPDNFTSKHESEFVIPYEVTGTWAFMYVLLPERIREAELLVYQSGQEEYIAYKNFYRQIPELRREEFRTSMSRLLDEEVISDE